MQILADRAEIQDLLVRYATAIDARADWDGLDAVFLPDARLDYRSAGGIEGPYPEVKDWLAAVLPDVPGDPAPRAQQPRRARRRRGRGTTAFHNPNEATIDGKPWIFTVGGTYHDRFVRTDAGWRIARRVEETLWWEHPMPGLDASPPPLPEPLDF